MTALADGCAKAACKSCTPSASRVLSLSGSAERCAHAGGSCECVMRSSPIVVTERRVLGARRRRLILPFVVLARRMLSGEFVTHQP